MTVSGSHQCVEGADAQQRGIKSRHRQRRDADQGQRGETRNQLRGQAGAERWIELTRGPHPAHEMQQTTDPDRGRQQMQPVADHGQGRLRLRGGVAAQADREQEQQ